MERCDAQLVVKLTCPSCGEVEYVAWDEVEEADTADFVCADCGAISSYIRPDIN